MSNNIMNKVIAVGLGALVFGCVQSRPSRNGVFNENQYVRKSFLIGDGSDTEKDPGWHMKATITAVSTPNPLGTGMFFLSPGVDNYGMNNLVRFQVTEDKLQLLSLRELTPVPSEERVPEVVNSWGVTNVDLKYRVNLDGETTNFLEENQELDWQQRQWVKVKFAKNEMSDVAPLGQFLSDALDKCIDTINSVTTLVPGSFLVDEKNNYMQWTVQIALPLKWDDPTCVQSYGYLGDELLRLGRTGVTFNLMYSFMRAKPDDQITYKPLEVAEKDAIRHKYGFIESITETRDDDSGQLAARELVTRFDPTKPIVWYFGAGFKPEYKKFFINPNDPNDPTTIKGQTNKLMKDAGAAATVDFREADDPTDSPLDGNGNPIFHPASADGTTPANPRPFGDIRYNFLVWMSDRDTQDSFAGLTSFVVDPRTGESLASNIVFNDFPIKDYYVQRLDAYLQTIGASNDVNAQGDWPDPGPCTDGDTLPIVPETVAANHNGNSSLYAKMQQYLQKPQSTYGNLGPQDFIVPQDDDFFRAHYALMPYYIFADPDTNPFVIREGGKGVYGPGDVWAKAQAEAQFQMLAADIDHGKVPYDDVTGPNGIKNATDFLNNFRSLTLAHRDYNYALKFADGGKRRLMDDPSAFSFEQIVAHDARHCINGKWETKQQWVDNLITTYWSQVAWHEFGHSLGLTHNFIASVDKPNFPVYMDAAGRPHYALYASSVMEYNSEPDRVFWHAGWAPYDQGAISWIYANDKPNGAPGTSITGQVSPTAPWKDPNGFAQDGTEKVFLFCDERHTRYTPFCRPGDAGTTPSEIIANDIDMYEWQYHWRNFRDYRKFWDNSAYANGPAYLIYDMRKFISLWEFDWSSSELADSLRRIGIKNPNPNSSDLEYYSQLTNKFNADASAANQMVAAFHKAVIQQSSGERPFATIYDKFYGDVTQQGIILDKLFAMQGWTALWPTDNYDQNQAGIYFASYSGIGDSSYDFVAKDAVTSMVGGQYDVYPYFVPLAVAQFAQDTHSPSFFGDISVRNWIGGHTFTRLQDFLDYFRDIAVQNNFPGCPDIKTCTFDPRNVSDTHNEFFGPDRRLWIWAYIPDRNQWVAVQKELNTASYIIVRNYTDDVVFQMDDGAFPGGAFGAELPMKYFLDSFNYYN